MKVKIEIDIKNIKVDNRYYNFDFVVKRNGKEVLSDSYSNDHAWQDNQEEFKQLLKNKLALQTVLESRAEEISKLT